MNRKAKIFFKGQLAGYLEERDDGYSFSYLKEYMETPNAHPISLTMPLSEKGYFSNVLFPFFDGLIPEGWLLSFGVEHWRLNIHDRFELLLNLCRDTIGAVAVYPMEAEEHA